MIQINLETLDACIASLEELSGESLSLSVSFSQSRGKTVDAELQIAELLQSVMAEELPALIENSIRLLSAVRESFSEADRQGVQAMGGGA